MLRNDPRFLCQRFAAAITPRNGTKEDLRLFLVPLPTSESATLQLPLSMRLPIHPLAKVPWAALQPAYQYSITFTASRQPRASPQNHLPSVSQTTSQLHLIGGRSGA